MSLKYAHQFAQFLAKFNIVCYEMLTSRHPEQRKELETCSFIVFRTRTNINCEIISEFVTTTVTLQYY